MRGTVLVILSLSPSVLLTASVNFSALQDEAAQTTEKRTLAKLSPESLPEGLLRNDFMVKLVAERLAEDRSIKLRNICPEHSFATVAIAALQKAGVSDKITG